MTKLLGACGKEIGSYCYPNLVDDLCVTCSFNGWNRDEEEEGL